MVPVLRAGGSDGEEPVQHDVETGHRRAAFDQNLLRLDPVFGPVLHKPVQNVFREKLENFKHWTGSMVVEASRNGNRGEIRFRW